jgi:hypothetical protein
VEDASFLVPYFLQVLFHALEGPGSWSNLDSSILLQDHPLHPTLFDLASLRIGTQPTYLRMLLVKQYTVFIIIAAIAILSATLLVMYLGVPLR